MRDITALLGRDIKRISFTDNPPVGCYFITLHVCEGLAFTLYAREVKLGRYEAYSIDLSETEMVGESESFVDWTVGSITILTRQEWLSSEQTDIPTVGRNPVVQTWGPVDPSHILDRDRVEVEFALIVADKLRRDEVMVYLSDYPEILYLTCDQDLIRETRFSYSQAAKVLSV